MSVEFLALFAIIPIVAILVLMVGFRLPAAKAMPISFFLTVAMALFIWQTPVNWILASTLEGSVVALKIILIVLGALALLFTLRECGALEVIKQGFASISPDRRIQTIIIAWFFAAFIEAAAGFGTPQALTAPLLLSVGFPALAAVMIVLIANSTCVSFGCVGTPTLIGIGSSLNTPEVVETLAQNGMTYAEFLHQVGIWTAIQHTVPGIIMPLIMVVMLTKFFGEKRSIKEGLAIWRYAIFAGFCFIVPYLAVAILLGPEFPSILGSLLGMSILIPCTKAGFLVPKQTWDFPERSKWEKNWMGSITINENTGTGNVSLFKAWIPYILIGLLLVLTRVEFLPFKSWITSVKFTTPGLVGTTVTTVFDPLNIPGIMPFMLIALLCIPMFKMNRKQVNTAWTEALQRVKRPSIALLFAVPLVRIMMYSGNNPNDYLSMPIAMAQSMTLVFNKAWPLIDTFVGALGSFIAGSNTVSNMLFALFQYSIAEELGMSRIIIVSLQNVGGAIGNMICVHNIVAACATVGLVGVEGLLIKRNLIPMSITAIMAGIIGMILLFFFGQGLF